MHLKSILTSLKQNPIQTGFVIAFNALIVAIPLVFYSRSSELFEFNKIVVLYFITTIILGLWALEWVLTKKFVFKKTFLDIPLIIFLASQIISTIFSIDQRSSLFGYYSRFNGGLFSILSYSLLYWAFVSHMNRVNLKRLLMNLFLATAISSIWGVMEHFGKSPSCFMIAGNWDASCWVQDVQLRVFATFGQPNWMAAWLAAVIFLVWISHSHKMSSWKFLISMILSALFFLALLFTKSRSGIAGFGIAAILFWGITFLQLIYRKINSKTQIPRIPFLPTMGFPISGGVSFVMFLVLVIPLFLKLKLYKTQTFIFFLVISLGIALSVFIVGSPWSSSFTERLNSEQTVLENIHPEGPALETGGTESGEIRKIVWEGAINVWRQFPVFGSGVETFAMAYYRGRPMAHNSVSEWNFLYNKAHNEYLNYLATTGAVGLAAYLFVIGAILYHFLKVILKGEDTQFHLAALAGFVSILVTNFFGFSVVPVSVLFYLLPAFSISYEKKQQEKLALSIDQSGIHIIEIVLAIIPTIALLALIYNYWIADYVYARAQEAKNSEDYSGSVKNFQDAITLSPSESLYHAELGSLYADLAVGSTATKSAQVLGEKSLEEIDKATTLSPQNVRILKSAANTYATLGDINAQYYIKTLELAQLLQVLAPTDPSVMYQQSLTFAKLGRVDDALKTGELAVTMKPDYKIARRLLAFLYEHEKQPQKARAHLEYILQKISPEDTDIQKELQGLPVK